MSHELQAQQLDALARQYGIELTPEQLEQALVAFSGELSDEALEAVAAGKIGFGGPGFGYGGFGVPIAVGPGFIGPGFGVRRFGGFGGFGGGAVAIRGPFGGGVYTGW